MDNFDTTNPNAEPDESLTPEEELSHSDKMIGVLTEPSSTFSKISQFPLKTVDWLVPVLALLLIIAVTNIVRMANPEIKMAMQEKQMEQIEKNLNEAVEKGQMTREQADQQIDRIRDQMAGVGMGMTIAFTVIGSLVGGFIVFFFITFIYFVFARFIFKDNGTFVSALIGNGLVAYIVVLQVIIATILSLAMGQMVLDTSVAAFINADRSTYLGWILAKIDPVSIWAYAVTSIGLMKLFRSESKAKYFGLVFGVWIIGGFILFLIAKAVPFLGMMSGM